MVSHTRIVDLTPDTIADYGVCGYKDAEKHLELKRKIEWYTRYYPMGLRIKAFVAEPGGYQGMIEYVPGKYAHRPVNADRYMFIHCIFVGFRKEFKGKGYASQLIDSCAAEARKAGMRGVAVVTRKGSFMADKAIFLKQGFAAVDKAPPDFELLALKFNDREEPPRFKEMSLKPYATGLTILRSPQCPYSVKNVDSIMKTARSIGLSPRLIELDDAEAAQNSPCAFGTFCIIKDGVVLSFHPISNTRFENILKKASP